MRSRSLAIRIAPTISRFDDLLLGEAAHFGDQSGECLQIGTQAGNRWVSACNGHGHAEPRYTLGGGTRSECRRIFSRSWLQSILQHQGAPV